VSDENAAVAEAEQAVRDHRDRLKAVMLMEVCLFKWDFELLDNEPAEIVAMVANSYITQLTLYRRTWGEKPDLSWCFVILWALHVAGFRVE
jgi:hypothetical protein